MYKFLSALFVLIRQFIIPNPFEALGEGLPIVLNGVPIILPPILLNLLAEGLLHIVTFGVVKMYYRDRSEPAVGSVLYMIFYAVHTGVIYLICSAYPSVFLMTPVIIGYIALHVLANRLFYDF